MKSRCSFLLLFALVTSISASAQASLSGSWVFDPSKSKNIGMMAQIQIRTVITQSDNQLTVDDSSIMNGQSDTQHTVYDLSGNPAKNTSMMGGAATTRSHWDGKRLITEWDSAGAIAGTTDKRTESRYLSPDGSLMYVESARPGREALILVFHRDR